MRTRAPDVPMPALSVDHWRIFIHHGEAHASLQLLTQKARGTFNTEKTQIVQHTP